MNIQQEKCVLKLTQGLTLIAVGIFQVNYEIPSTNCQDKELLLKPASLLHVLW